MIAFSANNTANNAAGMQAYAYFPAFVTTMRTELEKIHEIDRSLYHDPGMIDVWHRHSACGHINIA
ncbi:MAG: hypothetical protein ACD_39C01779G0001 [uncultured bacterium]|nr:MAG: hypothetical protein ACD_39C01779G0001 [uncultured bacterium]